MTSGKFMACQLAYKYQSLETSSNPILYIENNTPAVKTGKRHAAIAKK